MKKILTSPFDLVAKILEIPVDKLSEDSTMGETPNWDSVNHVAIIVELETSYDIKIPNEDAEKYIGMKGIIELYDTLCGNIGLRQRFINALKKHPVTKIFFK